MTRWPNSQFRIAINMAGAISAGAYTAGVLDFLIEALEEWESAKVAYRRYLVAPQVGSVQAEPVPLHDVLIDIFSGASAGGMCAAIAAVMVQQSFAHIRTATETGTTNTFYESWVNTIDIKELLKTDDLATNGNLVSLLDSSIIDQIASTVLTPSAERMRRPYVAEDLTLLLTLTNVRGVPYKLYDDPSPTIEESTSYYGDRVRFEITPPDVLATSSPAAKPLPVGQTDRGAWPLLKEAAKATGAFPIFLAPRILTRDVADYTPPCWDSMRAPSNGGPPLEPSFKPPPPPGDTWQTLNVDGGVCNNSPFQAAHDLLVSRNPNQKDGRNPREATQANCAVLTVAPFPSTADYDSSYDPKEQSGIATMLTRLVSVLISQSRFQGESLAIAIDGQQTFSRFVIAPSDPARSGKTALQCSALGAFGGFVERNFRAHDFLLGRRNCQQFLRKNFCLPTTNSVITAGLASAGPEQPQIVERWKVLVPTGADGTLTWLPLIPLCGTARQEVPHPEREPVAQATIDSTVEAVLVRLRAIAPKLLESVPGARILRPILSSLLHFPLDRLVKSRLREMLATALAEPAPGSPPAAPP